MIKIDFTNAEELILSNDKVRDVLPAFFANYFETWKLGKRIPALKQLGRQAIFDLLNSLNEEHILNLEELFGERIFIEKLTYNVVTNVKLSMQEADACNMLCNIVGDNYYSMWRDETHIYITFWR